MSRGEIAAAETMKLEDHTCDSGSAYTGVPITWKASSTWTSTTRKRQPLGTQEHALAGVAVQHGLLWRADSAKSKFMPWCLKSFVRLAYSISHTSPD